PLDNVLMEVCGEQFVAYDALDHRFDFTPRQPIARERGHMRLSGPVRLVFWPEGYVQQPSKGPRAVQSPAEHFRARRGLPLPTRVGSAQCASSKICSTGDWRVSASSCAVSASSVFCRRCGGVRSSGGKRPSFGSDNISAMSTAS